MTIENRPCPRCGVPHTARITDGVSVCFNCRASWRTEDPEGSVTPRTPGPQEAARPAAARPAALPPPEPPPYRFSARELTRLETYRAAVAAGFYNEGLDGGLAADEDESVDEGARPQAA